MDFGGKSVSHASPELYMFNTKKAEEEERIKLKNSGIFHS